jgi:hypothetical protein
MVGSTCAGTCTTASNWTDTAATVPAFTLLLDPTTPYAANGSGGQKGYGWVK